MPESLFNIFCIFQYIVSNKTSMLSMLMGSDAFGFLMLTLPVTTLLNLFTPEIYPITRSELICAS
jgi:hypothetical protein